MINEWLQSSYWAFRNGFFAFIDELTFRPSLDHGWWIFYDLGMISFLILVVYLSHIFSSKNAVSNLRRLGLWKKRGS